MSLKNLNIEYFFLISIFSWFLIGYSNFLNFILFTQLSLFLILELKVNYTKMLFTVIFVSFIIFFSSNIDAFKIYAMIIMFFLSFDFQEKNKIFENTKPIIFFFALFLFLIILKTHPHVPVHEVTFKLKKDVTVKNILKDLNSNFYPKGYQIKSYSNKCPNICLNQKSKCDENICKINFNYFQNRFTINKVDVNFISLVFLTLAFLVVKNLNKKNKLIFIYVLTSLLIIFLTKSRAGLIFFLISLFSFYYKNINSKVIISFFLLSHIFLIFLGFIIVNSVENPINMSAPTISKNGLIQIPIAETYGYIELLRLFQIFDVSNLIRFSTYFQSYLIFLNDFTTILFPDNTEEISNITYQTYLNREFLITKSDYHPHNFFMSLIKEIGLITTLYFYYLIFSHLKFERFKKVMIPFLFSSLFLGISMIFLIPTIIIFCFDPKNFFLKYFKQ